jgi:hypothetical protein
LFYSYFVIDSKPTTDGAAALSNNDELDAQQELK